MRKQYCSVQRVQSSSTAAATVAAAAYAANAAMSEIKSYQASLYSTERNLVTV
jgi:hypothetical protein